MAYCPAAAQGGYDGESTAAAKRGRRKGSAMFGPGHADADMADEESGRLPSRRYDHSGEVEDLLEMDVDNHTAQEEGLQA